MLDCSVLIALASVNQAQHVVCQEWLAGHTFPFFTCPITQGALARILLRTQAGTTFEDAKELLRRIEEMDRHGFLPDSIPSSDVRPTGVIGHQQVTDAYLAELARRNGVKLATLNRAQAALKSDIAEFVI